MTVRRLWALLAIAPEPPTQPIYDRLLAADDQPDGDILLTMREELAYEGLARRLNDAWTGDDSICLWLY